MLTRFIGLSFLQLVISAVVTAAILWALGLVVLALATVLPAVIIAILTVVIHILWVFFAVGLILWLVVALYNLAV